MLRKQEQNQLLEGRARIAALESEKQALEEKFAALSRKASGTNVGEFLGCGNDYSFAVV